MAASGDCSWRQRRRSEGSKRREAKAKRATRTEETQSSAGLRLLRECLRAEIGDREWGEGAGGRVKGARSRQHTRVQATRAHIDTTKQGGDTHVKHSTANGEMHCRRDELRNVKTVNEAREKLSEAHRQC